MVQTNEIKSIWDNPISNKIIKDITPTMEKYVDEQKIALQRVLAFPISPNKSELNGWWSEQEKLCMQWCQAFHIPWRQI
jgi:hypothetical protein